jgi:uncharacterized protein YigE (DUF2233 family)
VRLVYVPGVGWAEPPLELPPPERERLPLEVLKALGYFQVPEVGARYGGQGRLFRLVLDLPAPHRGSPEEGVGRGSLEVGLPYLVPGLLSAPWPQGLSAEVRLLPRGTRLTLKAPGSLLRYRLFPLENPPRLVLDLYLLLPEVEEALAPGVRYREVYAFTPEPLRLYLVEAERGRLLPVGTPLKRALPKDLAPDALAVLNGGYFDPKTGTPIGLWVQDGVTVSYPFGRVALMWDGFQFFLGLPRFEAVVVADRVQALLPAPLDLPAGAWALTFPRGLPPFPLKVGDRLSLYGRLDPPFRYALEGGPLLVQEGRYAFDPARENFKDPRPLQAVAPQAAVAWTREGRLWLLVSEPTTPGVLARGLLALGAWNALRMDGGGSAQLWVKGRLRSPYQGSPRPVVSALALYAP